MTRFDALRPAGMLAFYTLTISGALAGFMWLPYSTGWINADEFRLGLGFTLGLLAGGCSVAALWALARVLLRDKDPR